MKCHVFERKQSLSSPIEEVFPFFEKPENLERLTPPLLGMNVLTPDPIPMHVGAIIDYVVRVRGLPMRWTTCISEYDPPHRFVDVQLRGPYSLWHHTHEFHSTPEGTDVIDKVHYLVPLGPIGRVLNHLLIRHDINNIFEYRTKVLTEMFPDEKH